MSQRGKPTSTTQEEGTSSRGTTSKVVSNTNKYKHRKPFMLPGMNSRNFVNLKKGPLDPAGTLIRLSDRSSLCMSMRGAEVAIGSSDHAIYIIDVEKEKLVRALYGKQWGHTEWVTCVQYLDDGRILSGGMDSKLCMWEKNVVRCCELLGHNASVSGCAPILGSTLAVSSSYDKTLKIWNLMSSPSPRSKSPPSCVATLQGHKGAVTTFSVGSDGKTIMSGSRVGEVALWDGQEGRSMMQVQDAHHGQVNVVHNINMQSGEQGPVEKSNGSQQIFLSGGQDGCIQVWDVRTQPKPTQSLRIFKQSPVSYLATSDSGSNNLSTVVAGDKTLKVLDARASFRATHTMQDHLQSIFCLHSSEGLTWSGAADGKLLVHEVATGECLYGLGADAQGAVRCVGLAQENKLIVAGDDGNVLIYSH